tara:strand:+ start:318 stop:533 length:216 start_codon:yes stop_codon:yes gene_type:complete
MKKFFIKNREEYADGMGAITFFLIFLPLNLFEINFVFSFLLAFFICLSISSFLKANEAGELNMAIEEFEKR